MKPARRMGAGLAREWPRELEDAREDIYTLEDGQASKCSLVKSTGRGATASRDAS